MKTNITLFAQIAQLIPKQLFTKIANKYQSYKYSKGLDSWTHLFSMLFCHFSGADSVRTISLGLRSATGNLNHLGLQKAPQKSSISYLNKHRDWRLFKDFYFALYEHLSSIYNLTRPMHRKLKRKIFLLDATIIPLCLSVFDWAQFRKRKGAIKLHTMLDYDGCLPVFLHLTEGKTHEMQVAKTIDIPSGSVLVADRAYVDFKWLKRLDSKNIYFVTRPKKNTQYDVFEPYTTGAENKDVEIIEDARIGLMDEKAAGDYPEKLRLVRVWDKNKNCELSFLTNNFYWTALTVAELYKSRWEIEVFFKQLKQHLKIKTFVGTTPNAVLIQIWTAMITMLLLRFLKDKARYGWHLSNLITFVRLNLLVKVELFEWLNNPFPVIKGASGSQLAIFDSG